MSYWCDDVALGRTQQRRDAAQARALKRLAEQPLSSGTELTDRDRRILRARAMTYEWLTKGKRKVRCDDVVGELTVYPPLEGDIYPWVRRGGKRYAAIPSADGIYDIGKGPPSGKRGNE